MGREQLRNGPDTSSAAALIILVVEAAADALASLSNEPMPARSVAAAVTNSGAAITNDMSVQPSARRADLGIAHPSLMRIDGAVCSSRLLKDGQVLSA
jgi:hypothetical protein